MDIYIYVWQFPLCSVDSCLVTDPRVIKKKHIPLSGHQRVPQKPTLILTPDPRIHRQHPSPHSS